MKSKIAVFAAIMAGASALRMPSAPASGSRVAASTKLDRRGILAGVAGAFVAAPAFAEYTVPDLTYPYEALEPYIDAATMRFHHDKHHGARTGYACIHSAAGRVRALERPHPAPTADTPRRDTPSPRSGLRG